MQSKPAYLGGFVFWRDKIVDSNRAKRQRMTL